MSGKRINRIIVLKRTDDYVTPKGQHKTRWLCKCDCGNEFITTATNLRSGQVSSCGCYRDELRRENGKKNAKHHGYGTRLYRIYRGMWQRCYDKNVKQYSRYGGRGIKICEEWLGEKGFENFRQWALKNGYSDNLSIDRIDNDKGYSKDNCRWCTNKEQMNNRRVNVCLTLNGETHTMAEWSDITGINVATIKSRYRAGWSDEDILTKEIDKRKATKKEKRKE